jgi:hypothetical protein
LTPIYISDTHDAAVEIAEAVSKNYAGARRTGE